MKALKNYRADATEKILFLPFANCDTSTGTLVAHPSGGFVRLRESRLV